MNPVIGEYVHGPESRLDSVLERLLSADLFGEVMQGMVDSAWLRERAERVAASGDPFSNEKAAALFEAADAADGPASADAAP